MRYAPSLRETALRTVLIARKVPKLALISQNLKKKACSRWWTKPKWHIKNHALGFCLVTSGARLNDKKTDYIASLARAVSKEVPNLMLIACNGMATYEQLCELKNAGVFSYNHNLETSREYFHKILHNALLGREISDKFRRKKGWAHALHWWYFTVLARARLTG